MLNKTGKNAGGKCKSENSCCAECIDMIRKYIDIQ